MNGYYGKPVGITKPKPDEISVPLILDLIEGYYLVQKSKIKVFKAKKLLIENNLLEICRNEYHNFDKKYLVYKDFRDKGYIVNPGIKFGCDFAVYQKGPGIDHAPYLVQVYNTSDTVSATSVVLAGRLATTVRKQFILTIPRGEKKVDCLALDWWRA
jgi:tRNA-intron endonuclease